LRVGVVTAAALSDAAGIPAFGMCSLDAIRDEQVDRAPYAVATDARRKQVYWAVYDERGHRIEGPEIDLPDQLAAHLGDRVHRILGPAAQLVPASADVQISDARWPDAGVLAAYALECASRGDVPVPLVPMYLRRPDAREPGPPKRVTPA
jgi:tRNA threonylcarbamoyl adenosine modification protein YeaZ